MFAEGVGQMAGHSKWKNIQHRKGKQDALRGKLFTKISREIYVAVRNGGSNPETNFRLKSALEKARQANMPADNIQRVIDKASGNVEGVTYEEIVYEGYGPHGVAFMLDIMTDNRNRTAGEIRHIFSKRGGSLGETGCVSWMFQKKGILVIQDSSLTEEDMMLEALEAGAEDVESDNGYHVITTSPDDFQTVKETLEQKGFRFEEAEVRLVPQNVVKLQGEEAEAVWNLINALEEHDDVQNVYTNAEFDE
jgi:YebC/PmpR family DNA-binding regulatory protein